MIPKLINTNSKFYSVFKAILSPIYIWQLTDNDFELAEANDAAFNDDSYQKQFFIGVKASEFYKKNPSIVDDLKKCLKNKNSFEREITINFDDKSQISVFLFTFSFIDATTVLIQTKEINNHNQHFFYNEEHDQLLASFIELSPASIAMLDNDLRYIAASNKWISRYKLDNDTLFGKKHYDLFPEISEEWKKIHRKCLQGAIEKNDEDKFIRANGQVEWVKWEVRPWYNKSREIGGIMIFSEEITEQKNTEEKIKKDAEKLNKILENLPFGLSIENNKNETIFYNKTLIEMLGYDLNDVPNEEAWFQKAYPNGKYRKQIRKIWDQKVEQSLKTNKRCESIKSIVQCKDGSEKNIESYYVTIGDEYVTLVQDITDIKNKENQIKDVNEVIIQQNNELIKAKILVEESEYRLLQAQKAAKVGNWQTDLETLDVIWSEENYHTFEVDSATFQPTHESFLSYVHPEDRENVNEAFLKSFSSKEFNTVEHRIITAKGKLKYVEERWIVSFNENGIPKSVFGTCQDITERKLIELQLIETNIKIEENEHRLKLALDAAKLGVWEWIIEERKMIWDDNMFEMYGLKKVNQIIDYDSWVNTLHPEDRERAVYESTLIIENDKPIDTSFRIVKENGEVAYIKADAQIIKDKNGKPIKIIGTNRDITEKNLRKKALQEKEIKYRTLFETSVDAILLFRDNVWVDCNKSALKLFGTSKEKIIGSNPINFSPKYQSNGILSQDDINEKIKTVMNGESKNFEWEHCKEDGTVFIADVRLNSIEIDQKQYIQAIIRDITANKITENKLKEFRYFFENSNDLLAVSDEKGFFEIVNKKMIKTLGYSMEELSSKEYDEIIYQDNVDEAHKKAENLRNGIPLENFSSRILKKDNSFIWVEWNVFINKSLNKYYSIGRDISERKKFEEQLALSSLIVNSSHDAIISVSTDNVITSWNSGAEKIYGYNGEEIIGRSVYDVIPKEQFDEEEIIFQKLMQKELVDNFESKRVTKDGKTIDISLTATPILDELGNVIAISKIIRDISSQKLVEQEKKKIMNDLIQRNRDLEQFTNIVSHNLRAPVANIIGLNNYMIKKELPPEKKREMDVALNKSVSALDNVIRDLNNILQIRKEISEQRSKVKFSDLVEKITTSISNQIKKENVSFVLDFSKVKEMMTIKSYLYSIFYNLITNSIKYKQLQVNPVIEIRSAMNGKNIVLFFKDNGLGFDTNKNQNQIFGLYKRFHSHVEGKGLGLFMVKSQVESLGGKISVNSEINKGTEFKIEFEI